MTDCLIQEFVEYKYFELRRVILSVQITESVSWFKCYMPLHVHFLPEGCRCRNLVKWWSFKRLSKLFSPWRNWHWYPSSNAIDTVRWLVNEKSSSKKKVLEREKIFWDLLLIISHIAHMQQCKNLDSITQIHVSTIQFIRKLYLFFKSLAIIYAAFGWIPDGNPCS